jgi:hypothetical protein
MLTAKLKQIIEPRSWKLRAKNSPDNLAGRVQVLGDLWYRRDKGARHEYLKKKNNQIVWVVLEEKKDIYVAGDHSKRRERR